MTRHPFLKNESLALERRGARAHRIVRRFANGFTLVELLMVIVILSLLASLFLVAYQSASRESFNAKSRGTIMKISEVLSSRMQEYESYPVTYFSPIPSSAIAIDSREATLKLIERTRLLSLREIIRLEMPDHPDDLKFTTGWVASQGMPSTKVLATGLSVLGSPVYTQIPPTQRANRLIQRLSTNGTGTTPIAGWETTNANAELLYLIVEDSTFNGSQAIELFQKSELGDTDGDGLYEFLDAYGQPIQWVRWPTGFGNVAQFHPDLLDPNLYNSSTGVFRIDSDPLDRMSADPGYSIYANNAYRPGPLGVPLVASAGPDGLFGLRFALDPIPNSVPSGSRSSGDVLWPSTVQPASYGPMQFTDPWYPRDVANDDPLHTVRLGSIINAPAYLDDLTNYDGSASSL